MNAPSYRTSLLKSLEIVPVARTVRPRRSHRKGAQAQILGRNFRLSLFLTTICVGDLGCSARGGARRGTQDSLNVVGRVTRRDQIALEFHLGLYTPHLLPSRL